MIEYGSDYHRCDSSFHGSATIRTLIGSLQYYASGRMALLALVQREGWKRLWVPAYFCHEIIDAWERHITICLYDDFPLELDDDTLVRSLPYQKGDALLRMNFFGTRTHRTNAGIPVPVIEDHSHAITSTWAQKSDADWCIASLRKSLPLAFGGVLWSPKGIELPYTPQEDTTFELMATERYLAMDMKAHYLLKGGDKEAFRAKYIATEEGLDSLEGITAIDKESLTILDKLDVIRWNAQRQHNWETACKTLKHFEIPTGDCASNPFSIIIQMPTTEERNRFKSFLLQHSIFPAILWNIPANTPFARCVEFGNKMLSIHCDARYTEEDILQMCNIINQYDSIH